MSEKVIRLRMEESIYKEFKILCVKQDISIPKKTQELIELFIKEKKKV